MTNLSIIIPSRNRSNVEKCIGALRNAGETCMIIAIDNGMDPWPNPPVGLEPLALRAGRKPFIFARNINLGIELAAEQDIALLNDDARLTVTFHTNTKNGRSRQVPLTDDAIWAVQAMPKHGSTIFYNPDLMEQWTGDAVDYRWEKAVRLSDPIYDFMSLGTPMGSSWLRRAPQCTSFPKSWGTIPSILLGRIMPSSRSSRHRELFSVFFRGRKTGKRL